MKPSEALQLVAPGTLVRPGPVGRGVRLTLGLLCAYAVSEIVRSWAATSLQPVETLDERALILLAPLCLTSYVVNIGFARNWGNRPLALTLVTLIGFAAASTLLTGTADGPLFGVPLNLWLIYFYGHLGVSFLLAAILGTPGCEMRAIPDLLGRVRGESAREHHCPAGFITRIDAWERGRKSG